jgi:excinuclease ABC subunit B
MVIMYADSISDSMKIAIDETARRRSIQEEYNREHGIIPKTVIKEIRDLISNEDEVAKKENKTKMSKKEKIDMIEKLTNEMNLAAKNLDFERAMELRDIIFELESE